MIATNATTDVSIIIPQTRFHKRNAVAVIEGQTDNNHTAFFRGLMGNKNYDSYVNRQVVTLGVIFSAMVYGGVAVLTVTYIPLLLGTSHTISRRMRNFLLAYVTFMVAISTVNTVTLIIAFLSLLRVEGASLDMDNGAFLNGLAGQLCITLANWGADGFMLWRCAVLYEGISRPRRWATLTVLILLAMASLGFSTYFLINPNGLLLTTITIITTIINIIAAILIAARILYFQRTIRAAAGSKRDSQYTTIITICIESSVLIVFFSILCVVLFAKGNPASFIFMQSLVHVNVISPLLIVYRVALGKAVTCSQKGPEDGPVVSALHCASTRHNANGLNSDPEWGQS